MICHGHELTTLWPSLLFCTFTPQVLGSFAHTPTTKRYLSASSSPSSLNFFCSFFSTFLSSLPSLAFFFYSRPSKSKQGVKRERQRNLFVPLSTSSPGTHFTITTSTSSNSPRFSSSLSLREFTPFRFFSHSFITSRVKVLSLFL